MIDLVFNSYSVSAYLAPHFKRCAKKMKTAGNWVLIISTFSCGVMLSPTIGIVALVFGLCFAAITAFLVFSDSFRRNLGIALGLSAICAIAFSSLMFRTVPDAFPPYPPGIMDSLFPADHYPRSEMSFDAIDTRLHWYGLIGSLPLMLGLVLGITKLGHQHRNQPAQSGKRESLTPAPHTTGHTDP